MVPGRESNSLWQRWSRAKQGNPREVKIIVERDEYIFDLYMEKWIQNRTPNIVCGVLTRARRYRDTRVWAFHRSLRERDERKDKDAGSKTTTDEQKREEPCEPDENPIC